MTAGRSPLPRSGAHGGDVAAVARALGVDPAGILDLSVSLHPDAPDVTSLAKAHLDALGRYPDPAAATEAIADALGGSPEEVLVTNGGSEAIALVCADLRRAAVATPGEFSLYARHLEAIDPDGPRIRSNPHNPTGRLAGEDERAAVWDEAFYPLAVGRWSRGDAGTTVVGSLTKVFGCPGLRAGYVTSADSDLIARLAARQPRWAVNGLAAALIPELVAGADLAAWAAATATRRAALVAALPGVAPSDANFALVAAPGGAAGIRDALARHGVLVRDCTSFGLPGHVRVAVPDEAGLRRLVTAWERARLADPAGGDIDGAGRRRPGAEVAGAPSGTAGGRPEQEPGPPSWAAGGRPEHEPGAPSEAAGGRPEHEPGAPSGTAGGRPEQEPGPPSGTAGGRPEQEPGAPSEAAGGRPEHEPDGR